MPVVIGTVAELQIAIEIDVVGSVEPRLATTLSTEIAGLMQSFDLREGAFVQQGSTIVARLKAVELALALNEAEAELAKARADLTKLTRGLRPEEIEEKRAEVAEKKAWVEKYAKDTERTKSLLTRDMVSLSEFNQAEASYLAAKAQYERTLRSLRVAELGFRQEDIAAGEAEVQRLQAKVQRLRHDVEKTVIRAPVSGFITNRYVEVGQWLERGGSVADIIDLTTVLVRVPVHERDIRLIQVGDDAIVTLDALEPFRIPASPRPAGDPAPLPYLASAENQERGGFAVELTVHLSSAAMRARGQAPIRLSRSALGGMYWTVAQLITHHASNGCNLRPGDLLGTGTISGPAPENRGCLLELTWRGRDPVQLPDGETRRFLETGDEVILRGRCEREGFRGIGFGDCAGVVA